MMEVWFFTKVRKYMRLKGGDAFIFGRGGEEAEFLSYNNIKFEIIPGVSSLKWGQQFMQEYPLDT
jgi:siroheme synthase